MDNIHIGTSESVVELTSIPTLASRDFNGTESGYSVRPLNKVSPLARSHPIGLENQGFEKQSVFWNQIDTDLT